MSNKYCAFGLLAAVFFWWFEPNSLYEGAAILLFFFHLINRNLWLARFLNRKVAVVLKSTVLSSAAYKSVYTAIQMYYSLNKINY